jgi:hypothetical protein
MGYANRTARPRKCRGTKVYAVIAPMASNSPMRPRIAWNAHDVSKIEPISAEVHTPNIRRALWLMVGSALFISRGYMSDWQYQECLSLYNACDEIFWSLSQKLRDAFFNRLFSRDVSTH